jgi:hypothetical protein
MENATGRTGKDAQGQSEEVVEMENAAVEEGQEESEIMELTKEELEDKIMRESDRKVSKKLKELEAKHKKELEKRTEEARKDAEVLARLSDDERTRYEKEREEMTLTRQREELEEDRKQFRREQLMLEAEKQLMIEQMPVEFSQYVLGEDADDTFGRISVLKEQWRRAIEAGLNERLKSKSPRQGTEGKKGYFTEQQVDNMTREEVTANLPQIKESMQYWGKK